MQEKANGIAADKAEGIRQRSDLAALEKSLDNEFAHQQIEKKTGLDQLAREQAEAEAAKRERLRELRELDEVELRRAAAERAAFAARQKEFEEAFERKVVNVGKRQEKARKW